MRIINLKNKEKLDKAKKIILQTLESSEIIDNKYMIPSCFDVETTTVESQGSLYSFVYQLQFTFGDYTFHSRIKQNIIELIEFILVNAKSVFMLSIANLSFECSFFLKTFKEISEKNGYEFYNLASDNQQPVFCDMLQGKGSKARGIKIIDILRISGMSLKKTAENYCKHRKNNNSSEEYNYRKIRNTKTPLNLQEYRYCIYDTITGAEYMSYLFNRFTKQGKKFPYTSTGIVRNEMNEIFEQIIEEESKKRAEETGEDYNVVYKDVKREYHNNIRDQFPVIKETYDKYMKFLFRGGFVHGNAAFYNEIVELVTCVDFTSSYPAVIMQCKLPCEPFKNYPLSQVRAEGSGKNNIPLLNILRLKNEYAYIIDVTFYNLKAKMGHSLESSEKAMYLEGETIDNGRIWSADVIRVLLTEYDYLCYMKFYKCDRIKINEVQVAKKGEPPVYVKKVIEHAYKIKKELKDKGLDKTPEYAAAKGILNSVYGCMVQKLNFLEHTLFYKNKTIDEEGNIIEVPDSLVYCNSLASDSLLHKYKIKDKDGEKIGITDKYVLSKCKDKYKEIYNEIMDKREERKEVDDYMFENGVCLSDVINEIHSDNEWNEHYDYIESLQRKEREQRYYRMTIQKKILSPFWGIWVTSIARFRLCNVLINVERENANSVIYYDTDSLYIQDIEEVKHIIDEYNEGMKKLNEERLPDSMQDVGLFTFDPVCEKFKHLGAKRYIKTYKTKNKKTGEEETKLCTTIAGLTKTAFEKAFLKVSENGEKLDTVELITEYEEHEKLIKIDINNVFEVFNDQMIVSELLTQKMTPHYLKQPYRAEVTDEYGNTEEMTEREGVVLTDTPFSLNVAENYKELSGRIKLDNINAIKTLEHLWDIVTFNIINNNYF